MITTAEFLKVAQWVGFLTLLFAACTILAFILNWGVRFRLVGVTGFMAVLTGGLFTLGFVPLTHTVIPGAVRFSLVYDNGSTQAVIAVPPQIAESQLSATLRQAANDLFSYGRLARPNEDKLTIRARTIIHPKPGVSEPLYLGQIKRSLTNRNDEQMVLQLDREKIARLQSPTA
jgi:hypothetical protein